MNFLFLFFLTFPLYSKPVSPVVKLTNQETFELNKFISQIEEMEIREELGLVEGLAERIDWTYIHNAVIESKWPTYKSADPADIHIHKIMELALANQDSEKWFFIGSLYEKGRKIKGKKFQHNQYLALKSFQQAALLGHAGAFNSLAVILEKNQRIALAVRFYTQAVFKDLKEAQYNLARIFEEGNGFINKDKDLAYFLYDQAAKQGDSLALKKAEELEFEIANLEEDKLMKDLEISIYRYVAQKGYVKAQRILGAIYLYGSSTYNEKELKEEGVYWLREAALQGCEKCQYDLGRSYLEGFGVEKNKSKALYWLRRAAKNESHLAQFVLSQMHFRNEHGVKINKKTAFQFLEGLERQGYADMQYILGNAYLKEADHKDKKQLKKKAVLLFEKSAHQNYKPAIRFLMSVYIMTGRFSQFFSLWYQLLVDKSKCRLLFQQP